MAVPPMMFDLLCRVARDQGGGRACAAGYPDLLVPPQQLSALLGDGPAARVPVRADSQQIAAWHGVGKVLDKIFESRNVFHELGYELDVIDIHRARGDEIIVDLNLPLPADFGRTYDLVLDTGTCEHCFNIGQAAVNLASLVKKDGYLIQAMPLHVFNHGFYNVNPTWFHDFYPANGFRVQFLQGVANIVWNPQVFDLPAFERFNEAPANSMMIAVVKREAVVPVKLPFQHKYAVNPGLAV
jgi:hypothetical protein